MSAIPGRATSRSHPSPIKTVVVYRNGDAFFPGRRFVINPRQVSSFDSFLNTVTGGVEAPFGAVRNVYTPREGHRIQSLETLQHGEIYVAGGTERFKKINQNEWGCGYLFFYPSFQIKPVVHSRIIVPARWRKFLHESCTINVFTNGDVLVPPARILIPKYTLRSWERVLAMVTEKVHLRTGAVHRLYTLDGTPLSGSVELENNHYYVATGVERFRLLPYSHWVPRKGLIQDIGLGICMFPFSPTTSSLTMSSLNMAYFLNILFNKASQLRTNSYLQ
uniref:Doublecortin domain-containing protein n=1 Tax=Oncorhynchus mykiss TaxID=8022 RepID=A0A8C7WB38_ONCMY